MILNIRETIGNYLKPRYPSEKDKIIPLCALVYWLLWRTRKLRAMKTHSVFFHICIYYIYRVLDFKKAKRLTYTSPEWASLRILRIILQTISLAANGSLKAHLPTNNKQTNLSTIRGTGIRAQWHWSVRVDPKKSTG